MRIHQMLHHAAFTSCGMKCCTGKQSNVSKLQTFMSSDISGQLPFLHFCFSVITEDSSPSNFLTFSCSCFDPTTYLYNTINMNKIESHLFATSISNVYCTNKCHLNTKWTMNVKHWVTVVSWVVMWGFKILELLNY